jgi:predicted esterase
MKTPCPTVLLCVLALSAMALESEVPAGPRGPYPAYIPDSATKGKPCPLVVVCHGTGGSAGGFLKALEPLARTEGFAILCPQGAEKTEGAGFAWDHALERGEAIEAAIRALLKGHPEVDPGRVAWMGFSSGTEVCCTDGASRPDLCKGLVLLAPVTAELKVPPAGAPPRVCLLLGAEDPHFGGRFEQYVGALKGAKAVFSANRVSGLGHAPPAAAYLAGALRWVLDGTGPEEINTLPMRPPSAKARGCRHLLVRPPGTEAATRAAAGKRSGGEPLTDAAAASLGRLVEWACWTVPPGDVRVVRSPAGFHGIWIER